MRCPKCGFISFDHLEECLKCKKNIVTKADIMQGAVLNIAAPAFLALQTEQEGESAEKKDLFADQLGANEEYLDKDLEILAIDDEPEIVDEIELADSMPGESEVAESQLGLAETEIVEEMKEEEDGEIEIDLSLFEDAADPVEPLIDETVKEETVSAEPDSAIEVPRELADISDLAPPARDVDAEGGASAVAEKSDFPDMELGDLDFDLGLDDLDDNLATGPGVDAEPETMLVLDDFDFSDTPGGEGADTDDSQEHIEMGGDLNFDLDLGGLSMHEEL